MRVTLNQIAEAAGVSRGTVDRALNKRGRIKPEVEEKILNLAKEMGYQRNMAGRALAMSRANLHIGALVQAADTPFMKEVLKGIEEARAQVREFGFEVIIKEIESIDPERAVQALDELIEDGCQGIAILPSDDEAFIRRIDDLAEAGVPVVTFNSDIPESARQCFVGQDAVQSGKVAAGLMAMTLPPNSCVQVISGYKNVKSHRDRTNGFTGELSLIRPDIHIMPILYACDSEENAERAAAEAITAAADKKMMGIYLAAAGIEGVCRAVRKKDASSRVRIISNDLTEKNLKILRDGDVDFLIGQGPHTQGFEPIMILFRQLFEGVPARTEPLYTEITIKTRYNV